MNDALKQAVITQAKSILVDIENDVKQGSRDLIRYAADRRSIIADRIAANDPNLLDIVRVELLNIRAFATTEAVASADKLDESIVGIIRTGFAAFDTLMLKALD